MNEPSSGQAPIAPLSDRVRPLIFVATYFGGAAILAVIFTLISSGSFSADGAGMFLLVLLGALVYLPWGVLTGIQWITITLFGASFDIVASSGGLDARPANFGIGLFLVLSYASFLVLLILGSRAKNQKTFRRIYLAFLFLLILNMGGCLVNPP